LLRLFSFRETGEGLNWEGGLGETGVSPMGPIKRRG